MSSTHRSCARGCRVARRHLTDCPDPDQCRGCQPRTAEYGMLCYACHSRLTQLLRVAAGQHALLGLMAGLPGEIEMTSPTVARLGTGWRTSSSELWATWWAKPTQPDAASSEPFRLGCLDLQQEIEDRIGLWCIHLVNDYAMAPVDGGVNEGAEFLLRQIERLEYREGIGDECEEWFDIMSRAHCAAPWRDDPKRLRGIPCPECHATTLAMFGGDDDVSCVRCKAAIPYDRYLLWTRMLAQEQSEAGEQREACG